MFDSIDLVLRSLLIAVAVASNGLSVLPLVVRIRRGVWPRIADFGAASLLVFYAFGLIAELMSSETSSPLAPLFSGSESTTYITLALIATAPWMFHIGSMCVNKKVLDVPLSRRVSLLPRTRFPFFVATVTICSVVAMQGILAWMSAPSIWSARLSLGERWGPWLIWFYVPLYLLAFLASTAEIQDGPRRFAFYLVAVLSVCAVIPIGQRTLVLLPLVIVFMFSRGLSLKRALLVPAIAVGLAVVLLPLFKWQFDQSELSLQDMITATIQSDASRVRTLGYAVSHADPIGSYLLPYPMEGYVYSLAFFLPRSVAPWKGYSTAQFFTAEIVGDDVAPITWGLGSGAIEEIIVNAGLWLALPGLLAYGVLMGMMDRLSERIPSLLMPTRLATLWVAGYHIPALLLSFGPMLLISAGLTLALARPAARAAAAKPLRFQAMEVRIVSGHA